jgi:uncharacterized Zn finger protein
MSENSRVIVVSDSPCPKCSSRDVEVILSDGESAAFRCRVCGHSWSARVRVRALPDRRKAIGSKISP